MITFQKMWHDVEEILEGDEIKNIDIIEQYNNGFVVKETEDVAFVTKDDFVDFWCKLLYFNEVSREQLKDKDKSQKYVYDVVKTLPYAFESDGILKLME